MSSGDSEEIEQEQEEEDLSQDINIKSVQKVMINKDKDEHNGTFVFFDEDHTLGNSLRFVLVNQVDVDFCGYSLPHPSENKMNLRLQTINQSKEKVMNDGLKTIVSICDIIEAKFRQALNEQN